MKPELPAGPLQDALNSVNQLLQFRVLEFGLLEDSNVGISVFPYCKEILVGSSRTGFVAFGRPRTGQTEFGERLGQG